MLEADNAFLIQDSACIPACISTMHNVAAFDSAVRGFQQRVPAAL